MKSYALICAYNEETTANEVIRNALKYVDKVIFVNDGSKDRTFELAQKEFGNNKRVIIISYNENHGKGYAIRMKGFRRFVKEDGDILVTLDADKQHSNPKDIPVIMSDVENGKYDIVIGTRYKRKTSQPTMRYIFNKSSSTLLKILTGEEFDDISSGFRCYSKKAVKTILPSLKLNGFGIEPEILQVAAKNHLRILTIPVSISYEYGKKPNFSRLASGYFRFAIRGIFNL